MSEPGWLPAPLAARDPLAAGLERLDRVEEALGGTRATDLTRAQLLDLRATLEAGIAELREQRRLEVRERRN